MEGTIATITEKPKNNNITTDVSLPDDVLEKLYQRYSIKQRRAGLGCFLCASVLFDLWAIFIPQGQTWQSLGITCIFLLLNISLGIFLHYCGSSRFRGAIWEIAPSLAWLFAILQLFLHLFFKGIVTPRDSLGWGILLNFLIYVTLPVPLKFTGLLIGLGSLATYVSTIFGLVRKENFVFEQQGANICLLITAATIGLLCYFLGEAKQRRAFLEAKQSLEVKMIIEEQSAEQERLLLSVLPEHVAVKMRQDIGSDDSEQFKKIYMRRHENVSILYADIVGFTAISSTYSAQDLVKMLNELFARFDRLAEKYQQLRIKILGDCYYCISGAPVERPDHAVMCVHMGLSMVKAIKYVQQKTNSPVDMRVGIHTGAVLAGILGKRQWQFDVYSKDVELANKMESSGKAGSVHISERTLGFLNGEFEVEPAYGEKREEALRIAGLKTYFITKVIKPFTAPISAIKNGQTSVETIEGPKCNYTTDSLRDEDDDLKCNSGDEEANAGESLQDKVDNFKTRLRKELVSRDGHGELTKDITMCLTFKDVRLESSYSAHREPLSSIPLIASLLVHIVGGIYSLLVLPRTVLHFIIIFAPLGFIAIIVLISVAESFPTILPSTLAKSSKAFNDSIWLRRLAAVLTVLLISGSNLVDMFACSLEMPVSLNISNISDATYYERHPSNTCMYPSYFSNYCVLILISSSIIAQLSHIAKIIIMCIVAGIHCYINVFELEEQYRNEEYHTWNARLPLRYSLSALLLAVTVALSFLSRHIDKEDRVIFMWKTEVAEQKERASDMRRRNEALVYNVLPVHVAEHFMGNRRRSYDELYSQSYAEVGVLFASMPNFSDFYSEETVNNQGLECLRFLNEVIWDFDSLLELPQFQDIIKIKTIGSTYMAASGLNPSRHAKPEDTVAVRWAHLSLLVEFALELKKALQSINEQSFNHFVLKMGVNHGPITAGVIGARKPHYDIWGNTVNVASRMESTGKAGAIQVTEETCNILQPFGYSFEQRGLVAVKGKGQLMTYYLQGKSTLCNTSTMTPNVPNSGLETVEEIEETPKTQPKESNVIISVQTDSISTSSASPNSIRINQSYVSKQEPVHTSAGDVVFSENQPVQYESNAPQMGTSVFSSVVPNTLTHLTNSNADIEMEGDAETPLLGESSTNTNEINGDERDALIVNTN